MSEAPGAHPDTEKQAILEDIAVRVRGYARHLAVHPYSHMQRSGVYRLPESAGIIQQPYLHAWITSPSLGEEPQFGLALADKPVDSLDGKMTSLNVTSERDGIERLFLFNRYWDDPWTPETISKAMATRVLRALKDFDKLIPDLQPEPQTASSIAWLNSRYESWRA